MICLSESVRRGPILIGCDRILEMQALLLDFYNSKDIVNP